MNNFSRKVFFLVPQFGKRYLYFCIIKTNQEAVEKFFENLGRIFRGTLTVGIVILMICLSVITIILNEIFMVLGIIFFIGIMLDLIISIFVTGRRN